MYADEMKMKTLGPAAGPKTAGTSSEAAILRTAICGNVIQLCVPEYGERLLAAIVTGSLARDEATFVRDGEGWRVLGDAEFFLVFKQKASLPSTLELEGLQQKIECALRAGAIACHVGLSAVHPRYLRALPPHIFAYELREHGRVLWGDDDILSLIPAFSAADIPLEDAWRLLANRMIEHVEVASELAWGCQALPTSVYYRTLKLYLDMATSLLVFAGAYAPSYYEREGRLKALALAATPLEDWPFFLGEFCIRVSACTEWKLSPDSVACDATWEFWERAVQYTCQLWRWELSRLTGLRAQSSDDELMRRWMLLQPYRKRLRGWVGVLRECGWHQSWRQWARWGRHAWRASPRYWMYAAASQLFLRLPRLVKHEAPATEAGIDFRKLNRSLPVESKSEGKREPWRQLAAQIGSNYHTFVEITRS